jgi:hypothetical protein
MRSYQKQKAGSHCREAIATSPKKLHRYAVTKE